MRRALIGLLAGLTMALAARPVYADPREDVIDLYRSFASAQNAHDLKAVRRLMSDSPDFLWVSDGMPVWGADAAVERMTTFQQSETWRVEPELERSRAVELSDSVAFLQLPLTLVIGSSDRPDRLRFLVGLGGRRRND